jgi:hypothetical protein
MQTFKFVYDYTFNLMYDWVIHIEIDFFRNVMFPYLGGCNLERVEYTVHFLIIFAVRQSVCCKGMQH